MKHLKMLGGIAKPVARPVWVEKIVFVTDYLNRPLQDVAAPEAGIVMFIRAVPSLKKGDTIVNIGVVSTTTR